MFRKVIGQKPGAAPDSPEPATKLDPNPPAAPTAAPAPTPVASSSPAPAASVTTTAAPQSRPATASRNVLSSDVEIKGTVKFTNDLVVDGKIEGEISSDGNLTVGENARLKAEIKTATVVVYGKVHGNITAADRVDLKASAEVVGDIKTKTLTMEAGAIFVGKSTIGTPSTPAQTSPSKGQSDDKGGKPTAQQDLAGMKS